MSIVDTHCHLSDRAFAEDLDAVIERARSEGVTKIVAVGGGGPIEDSERSAQIAERYDFIRATAGIHPHDAESWSDEVESAIDSLLLRDRVVAVGETGLDYFYDNSPREKQREVLGRHLALARKHGMPVVIHCRDAAKDLHDVLRAEAGGNLRGAVHCFTGEYEDARIHLDMGLLISFTGILTFKNASDLRETARRLPLDRLMVETDAPLLAPSPYRGKRNEPAWTRRVVEVLAELHGTNVESVAEATSRNAEELFFS